MWVFIVIRHCSEAYSNARRRTILGVLAVAVYSLLWKIREKRDAAPTAGMTASRQRTNHVSRSDANDAKPFRISSLLHRSFRPPGVAWQLQPIGR